jgi:integrase
MWTPPERRLVATAPVFVNPETEARWHPSSERRVWLAACKKVGVRIRPNEGGRHFFATAAVASGTELGTLQRYLGHVDPKTTQRYIRLVAMGRIDVLKRPSPGPKLPQGAEEPS